MQLGSSQMPYRLFFKTVGTWAPDERVLRLFRVVWSRGHLGNGGYTAKVSFALMPKLLQFKRGYWSLLVVLLGVRVHYMRSYGGALQ